jgi:hypothetical protein
MRKAAIAPLIIGEAVYLISHTSNVGENHAVFDFEKNTGYPNGTISRKLWGNQKGGRI